MKDKFNQLKSFLYSMTALNSIHLYTVYSYFGKKNAPKEGKISPQKLDFSSGISYSIEPSQYCLTRAWLA